MEVSRDEEDKDEQITIPYVASMQPIRKLEGLQVLVVIDGEISAVESYLTLSHKFLFKENEFTAKYEQRRMKEGYASEILTEG